MPGGNAKVFAVLFFSIFGAMAGVGLIVPLLPVYARDLGADGVYIGLIFGSFSLSRFVLLPVFGRLSDKAGRKPLIVAGLLGYTLVSVAFVFTRTLCGLAWTRLFQGIASAMIIPVAHAYIGDISPPGKEGRIMGLFNMSMFAGLGFGPLAGGIIGQRLGINAAFSSMGVLTLTGFLLSFFFLPPKGAEPSAARSGKMPGFSVILRDPEVYGLFLLRFFHVFCLGVIWCFLPVMSSDFGLSDAATGFLITSGVLVSGVLQVPMGAAADRGGRRKIALCGALLAAAAISSFQWTAGFASLFAASLFFGAAGGIGMPALMAMAVKKGSDSGAMGSLTSVLTMAHSLGMALGAFGGGLAMDLLGLRQAFTAAGALMLFGALVFAFLTSPDSARG